MHRGHRGLVWSLHGAANQGIQPCDAGLARLGPHGCACVNRCERKLGQAGEAAASLAFRSLTLGPHSPRSFACIGWKWFRPNTKEKNHEHVRAEL